MPKQNNDRRGRRTLQLAGWVGVPTRAQCQGCSRGAAVSPITTPNDEEAAGGVLSRSLGAHAHSSVSKKKCCREQQGGGAWRGRGSQRTRRKRRERGGGGQNERFGR